MQTQQKDEDCSGSSLELFPVCRNVLEVDTGYALLFKSECYTRPRSGEVLGTDGCLSRDAYAYEGSSE